MKKSSDNKRVDLDGASLTERAYKQLEELIVTLQLAPGSLISEAALTARLSIGRTPIREALQRLAREKLVVILPRRGMFVSHISVASQLKLLELRREVERLMARSAARRATAEQRAELRELAAAMERSATANDDLGFMRLDNRLNGIISEAAQNEFATASMAAWHSLSRRFWYQHYQQVADMPLAAKLHADVARSIAGGDEASAGEASDRLLDYLEAFTRATVENGT